MSRRSGGPGPSAAVPFVIVVADPSDPEGVASALRGRPVLGVELTDAQLETLCTLGNIDPQHGVAATGLAAIEAALDHPIPADDAALVTIRPDLDAFGAMAVLRLRRRGLWSDAALPRVREIAEADGPRGAWPGRCPAGARGRGPGGELEAGEVRKALASRIVDPSLAPSERVELVGQWLLTGSFDGDAEAIAGLDAQRAADLEITQITERADGRVAVVVSTSQRALFLGYDHAPVVVAECPRFVVEGRPPYRKLTVAQHDEGYLDLAHVLETLRAREAGWGGAPTIIGSPQGRPSEIPLDEVVAVVIENLLG